MLKGEKVPCGKVGEKTNPKALGFRKNFPASFKYCYCTLINNFFGLKKIQLVAMRNRKVKQVNYVPVIRSMSAPVPKVPKVLTSTSLLVNTTRLRL